MPRIELAHSRSQQHTRLLNLITVFLFCMPFFLFLCCRGQQFTLFKCQMAQVHLFENHVKNKKSFSKKSFSQKSFSQKNKCLGGGGWHCNKLKIKMRQNYVLIVAWGYSEEQCSVSYTLTLLLRKKKSSVFKSDSMT